MARPTVSRTPFGQRLTAIREALGFNERKAFAALLGVNAETLGGYERGDNMPNHEFLTRYKHEFSVNLDWLITGDGEMRLPGAEILDIARPPEERRARAGAILANSPVGPEILQAFGPRPASEIREDRTSGLTEFVRLPFYHDVAASAGPGALAVSEQSDSVIAFARSFLRDHGAVPDRCSIIRARGDSMAPTIPDASLLVVDHSQAEIANGCIMVVSVGDDLLVKRVRRRLDGQIDLISDNPAYPPETLQPAALQQLRVVGRVVYFCRAP